MSFKKFLFPKRIELFVTYKCNLNCEYCFLPAFYFLEKDPSSKQLQKIISKLKEKGVQEIDILGGEPLVIKEKVFQIFSLCNKYNIKILSLATNGTLIDNEVVFFLKKYKDLVIDISVNAGTVQFYKISRGRDFFKKLIKNIKQLKKNNLKIILSFILFRKGINEIEKFIKLAKELKIKELAIKSLMPIGRGEELNNEILSLEELNKIRKLIVNLSKRYYLKIYGLDKNEEEVLCPAGKEKVVILPNGDIYPCGLLISFKEARIGNIFNNQLIIGKWLEKFLNFSLPTQCKSCNLVGLCAKGCKAFIYSRFKTFSKLQKIRKIFIPCFYP